MAKAEINCAVFVLICVNVALVSPELTRGAAFMFLQLESKHAASASCCWRAGDTQGEITSCSVGKFPLS